MNRDFAGRDTFFGYKEDLETFSLEIHSLTVEFEKKIRQNFSKDMVKCADIIYDAMRFQTDCAIGKFRNSEIKRKKEYGADKIRRCLGDSADPQMSYSELEDMLRQKGKPLLMVLDDYKASIVSLYEQYASFLWHVSSVPDLMLLYPSLHRENMYYNEVCNAVFATSDYEEVLLYIGRVSGEEMAIMDHVCLYRQKPYQSWNNREIRLKNKAVIYYLNIKDFEPVIDFVMGDEDIHLKFGHEWICRGNVPVCKSEQVLSIPVKNMRFYHVYYGLKNISLAPYVDKLGQKSNMEKRESYLQKLMDEKKIAFVNFS